MEDVGRLVEPSRLSPISEPASIPTLEGWIESLMACKQLAEVDVQRLCDKVYLATFAHSAGIRDASRVSNLTLMDTGTGGSAGGVKCAASCRSS